MNQMQALQKSPRFKFDRPVYDFEALKPRILRAAYAVLANTDETFWKGKSYVTFQGTISFEVTFPRGFRKPKGVDPLEIFRALNRRGGEQCLPNPDIALVNERLEGYLKVNDWVNFIDYLDDYIMLLNETLEERNRYFYGLLVKTINSLKQVEYPEHSYMGSIDYNSAAIIRKVRLAKMLDAVWITFEKVKLYLRQDKIPLIESKLKHVNHLIIDTTSIETIDQSIKQIDGLIKDNLDPKTVDWLFEEAQNVAADKMKLVHERSKLVFSNFSDHEIYLKLALLYKKTIEDAERSQLELRPKINVKGDYSYRVDRLNAILSFVTRFLSKYPTKVSETDAVDNITALEHSLIGDPEVVKLFQRSISLLTKGEQKLARTRSAQSSLVVNLKNQNVLNAYRNVITLFERLA